MTGQKSCRIMEFRSFIEKRFNEWAEYRNLWQTRGWGLLKAVDFQESKEKPLVDYKEHVQNELFKRGIITMSGGQGQYRCMLRLIPSFNIPDDHLDISLDIFEEVMTN